MSNEYNEFKDLLKTKNNLSDVSLELIIPNTEFMAKVLLKDVSPHQIRRFFQVIKSIQVQLEIDKKISGNELLPMKDKAKLLMLKPQMVNSSERQNRSMNELIHIYDDMIKIVKTINDFYQLKNFFETLVAYNKVYGKKN